MLIMAALSVSGASAIYYSSRSQATAEYAADKGNSADVAEAGMNFARSLLWDVVDTGGDPTNQSVLPSSASPATTTVNGQTVSYYGEYDSGNSTWTLVGEASVKNPAGTGSITRAVETKVQVTPGTPQTVWIWGWSYSAPDSCVTLGNSIEFNQPFKVDGSICLSNSAKLLDDVWATGSVNLGSPQNSVGKTSDYVDRISIAGGCYDNKEKSVSCTPAESFYATDNTVDTSFTGGSKPAPDWSAQYAAASPGPSNPCGTNFAPGGAGGTFDTDTIEDNQSLGAVDLTPTSSYTCVTGTGEISFNSATNILSIDGLIYIDGDVELDRNVRVLYEGRATIYVSGGLTISNQFEICGVSTCDAAWDPMDNALIFVVGEDFTIRNNSIFQAGALVEGDYSLQNNAENFGPIIANNFEIENSGDTFIPITGTLPGLPTFGETTVLPAGPQLINVANSYISYTPGAGNDPGSGGGAPGGN